MSWKHVPAWVPAAYTTIIVWLVLLYFILKYVPIAPEQQPILVLLTVMILLIGSGSLLYYYHQRLFGTRYNPDF